MWHPSAPPDETETLVLASHDLKQKIAFELCQIISPTTICSAQLNIFVTLQARKSVAGTCTDIVFRARMNVSVTGTDEK